RRDRVQAAVADQVSDVRRDPLGAGLDELVIVGLREVLLEHGDLLSDHVDQGAQRVGVPCLTVAQPMDDGKQFEETLRVEAHGMSPGWIGRSDRVRSSAASASASELGCGTAAGRGWSSPLPPTPSVRTRRSTSTATTPGTGRMVATASVTATRRPQARA